MKEYAVDFKLNNPDRRMQLCYLGECDDSKLENVKKEMDKLKGLLPIECSFSHSEGDKSMTTRTVNITDPEKATILLSFHKKFFASEEELPFPIVATPIFYVTDVSMDEPTTFITEKILLKQIGRNEPIYSVSFIGDSIFP